MYDDDGEEIEFEDDSDDLEEDRQAQYMDEQEVVQADDSDEWGDEDGPSDSMQIDGTKKRVKQVKEVKEEGEPKIEDLDPNAKPMIWNDQTEPLKEDEELDYDASAYEMLHRVAVEMPCLSIDPLIRERIGGPTGIFN